MTHSAHLNRTQETQYHRRFRRWAPGFHLWLKFPPALPLNPVNPDNARTLRITAAAGTELAGACSSDTVSLCRSKGFLLRPKKFTTQRAFILHAAWLVQASAHWPIFLTAASRRSWTRVSVSMWGFTLSRPLLIIDLVSRYLTNNLIRRTLISYRRNFNHNAMPHYNTMRYYSQFPKAIPL